MQSPECPHRNKYCFVCGLFTPEGNGRNLSENFVLHYERIYIKIHQPNLWYVPEIVCNYCSRLLPDKTRPFKYVAPVIWRSVIEHIPEMCYFCQTQKNVVGFRYNTRERVNYAQVSTMIPARLRSTQNPHTPFELYVREQAENVENREQAVEMDVDMGMESEMSAQPSASNEDMVSEFVLAPSEQSTTVRHLITQAEFDDVVRETKTSKRSGHLGSNSGMRLRLIS